MTPKQLNREVLFREFEKLREEIENIQGGMLRALAFRGKKEKLAEIIAEIEIREKALNQIRKIIEEYPYLKEETDGKGD